MRRRLTRRGALATIAATAGCLEDVFGSGDPAASVEPREWPAAYYGGPLVSAHEHMHGPDGFGMTDETMDWYVRWMARNRVAQAMAITYTDYAPVVSAHDDRLVPYCHAMDLVRDERDRLAAAIAERLDEYPLYEGVGEFGLFHVAGPSGEPPLPANDPVLLDVYDLAAERDLPVMVHGGQQGIYGNGEDPVDHMVAAFEHNRDCTFLVHGTFINGVTIDGETEVPVGEAVATLFDRHPNFVFDISGQASPYAYNWRRPPDDDPTTISDQETRSQTWFETQMRQHGGVEGHAQRLYDRFQPILENYSERVTWGMDASWQWHFNDWVLDTWVDVGRSALGRLPEAKARNVGYRTAAGLFEIDVEA
ncbi:amidohydrolase family protein [Salinarchaeum chitinilyticum]